MFLNLVTKEVFAVSPFIDVKPLFTVRLAQFRPQKYKFRNIFDFNKQIKQSLYMYGQTPLVAEG